MKTHDAVNASLATLLFNFNNRYSFFQNQSIMTAYRSAQLFDVNAKTANDFEILTQNSLLAALQNHAITLNESVKAYCIQTGRDKFQTDSLFDFIRNFVSELRNAKAHMGKRFLRFTWERSFHFDCWIPIEKMGPGQYRFNHNSPQRYRIRFKATKGREVRITPGFMYKLITLSFHLIKILSFRKKSTCDRYLTKFPGAFKKK
jgi:hypothetical protein